jgi:hypothetical protein
MNKSWERIASRSVGEDRKIRIPDNIVEWFVVEGKDDSVFWNYERNSKYLILSDRPLSDPEYQPLKPSKIYNEGGYRKVRPPSHFSKSILSKFYEGNELFYLAHEDMVSDEGRTSVYLLTQAEVREILPQTADADSDLQSKLMSTPGVLPSI